MPFLMIFANLFVFKVWLLESGEYMKIAVFIKKKRVFIVQKKAENKIS